MNRIQPNQEITAQVNATADHFAIEIPNTQKYVVVNKKDFCNTVFDYTSTLTVEVFKPGYHIPYNQLSANCKIYLQRFALKILYIVTFTVSMLTLIIGIFSSLEVGMLIFAVVLWVIIIIIHIFKKRKEDRMYLEIFSNKEDANRFALANTSYSRTTTYTHYIDRTTGQTTNVTSLSYVRRVNAKILE